jgi:hypothetical protein
MTSETVTSSTAGTHAGAPDNSPNKKGIISPYSLPTTQIVKLPEQLSDPSFKGNLQIA